MLSLPADSVLLPDTTTEHFQKALASIRPSVSNEDMAKYEEVLIFLCFTSIQGNAQRGETERKAVRE